MQNSIPGPQAAWTHTEITVSGNVRDARGRLMTETLDLWGRDPVHIAQDLIGHKPFDGHIAYGAVDVEAQMSGEPECEGPEPGPDSPEEMAHQHDIEDGPDDVRMQDEGEASGSQADGDGGEASGGSNEGERPRRRWQQMHNERTRHNEDSQGGRNSSQDKGDSVSPAVVNRIYEQVCDSEWWKDIMVSETYHVLPWERPSSIC